MAEVLDADPTRMNARAEHAAEVIGAHCNEKTHTALARRPTTGIPVIIVVIGERTGKGTMSDTCAEAVRAQSFGEEIANFLSHGIGLLLAVAAIPILVVAAAAHAGAAEITGVSIFGATMVLTYLSSSLYHALPPGKGKQVMQLVDHGAIFLLIAGTYTPFTLGTLWGAWGWSLFGVVWGLALVGLVLKACVGTRYQSLSVGLYLAMGWLVLIAIRPLYLHLPAWGLFWLVLGGLAYTIGVIFFVLDEKVRYAHAIWHVFVLAGTACHFVAVLWYAA